MKLELIYRIVLVIGMLIVFFCSLETEKRACPTSTSAFTNLCYVYSLVCVSGSNFLKTVFSKEPAYWFCTK